MQGSDASLRSVKRNMNSDIGLVQKSEQFVLCPWVGWQWSEHAPYPICNNGHHYWSRRSLITCLIGCYHIPFFKSWFWLVILRLFDRFKQRLVICSQILCIIILIVGIILRVCLYNNVKYLMICWDIRIIYKIIIDLGRIGIRLFLSDIYLCRNSLMVDLSILWEWN